MIIRNLSEKETENLRMQFNERLLSTVEKWHAYWYPLYPVKSGVHVIAFESNFIARAENFEKVRNIFIRHNTSAIIELREFGNARLIDNFTDKEYFLGNDEDGVILPYMSECFWFDERKDWIMYVSHEGTISFGGEWLVNSIKEQLKNYSEYEMKDCVPRHNRNYD